MESCILETKIKQTFVNQNKEHVSSSKRVKGNPTKGENEEFGKLGKIVGIPARTWPLSIGQFSNILKFVDSC